MTQTIDKSELMKMLGAFVSVANAPSRNGCNRAPNQFIIQFEHGKVFQSYRTLIGAKIGGKLYLTDDHNYSNTTSRHCGKWCGKNCAERRKGIEDGNIILIV